MATEIQRPPYDPELGAALDVAIEANPLPPLNAENLDVWKEANAAGAAAIAEDLAKYAVESAELTIAGPRGDIALTVISPRGGAVNAPAIYHIHGGGMILGDRYTGLSMFALIEWVATYGLVVVTVEYRMAPEFPGLAAVEDCHAGLLWTAEHASELGIDPDRIIVAGASGGGGLAGGTVLLNRDRSGPPLLGQALWCPQLDDRNNFPSVRQFAQRDGVASLWPREYHEFAWDTVLGEGHEDRDDVSIYAAANRALDLSGLPPAFLDVGDSEVFRDFAVDYASKLWAAGVQAELHVWPGGFHGFDVVFPAPVPVAVASRAARENWLRRMLER